MYYLPYDNNLSGISKRVNLDIFPPSYELVGNPVVVTAKIELLNHSCKLYNEILRSCPFEGWKTDERFIQLLASERKNSLFIGGGKMVGVSAAYHIIISTCKMQGISVLQYLKIFFWEIVNGLRGYENPLPMTIGLGDNKL